MSIIMKLQEHTANTSVANKAVWSLMYSALGKGSGIVRREMNKAEEGGIEAYNELLDFVAGDKVADEFFGTTTAADKWQEFVDTAVLANSLSVFCDDGEYAPTIPKVLKRMSEINPEQVDAVRKGEEILEHRKALKEQKLLFSMGQGDAALLEELENKEMVIPSLLKEAMDTQDLSLEGAIAGYRTQFKGQAEDLPHIERAAELYQDVVKNGTFSNNNIETLVVTLRDAAERSIVDTRDNKKIRSMEFKNKLIGEAKEYIKLCNDYLDEA